MSRVGKVPIPVPSNVVISQDGNRITVKGPRAELRNYLPECITITVEPSQIKVIRSSDSSSDKAFHGLWRTLLNNMIIGVTEGFEKKLELRGTGYRVQKKGNGLQLSIGFSHSVFIEPIGLNNLTAESSSILSISGPDKQHVGEQAASIRKLRKPNPFTGNGIKYIDETIRRKAGKSGSAR